MINRKELDEVFSTLSVRAKNCLRAADVHTLDELLEFEKGELKKFRNFGRKTYNEVTELIESLGYEFGQKKSTVRMTPELFVLLVKIKKHEGSFDDIVPLINELKSIL